MTHNKLTQQLSLLHKDVVKVDRRMSKIAKELNIPHHQDIEKVLKEVEEIMVIAKRVKE